MSINFWQITPVAIFLIFITPVIIVLSSLFAGCLVGLLLFIRVVKKAYEDYPDHLLGFFYSLVFLSIPLLWKSDEWKISLP